MRNRAILIVLAAYAALPAAAMAQDPQSIMQSMLDKQRERREGVDTYLVDQTMMANRVQRYFQRVTMETPDGESYDIFRSHPLNTDPCGLAAEGGFDEMTPEMYEQAAGAYEMTGDVMGNEIEDGLEAAGLPRGLLAATGGDPWASFDPRVMMGSGAMFMRAAGEAKRQQAIENARPDTSLEEMRMYADKSRLIGTESIDGRDAYHLRAEDLGIKPESDGQTFTIENVDSWIDTKEYVPLRMLMTGVATDGHESRPIEMEKRDLDYRRVPDSHMYESYRQVMRISGVMDAKQQAEMQEAQQQMAEFEKEMAQMPPSQREMIMRQMGPQMEMMKNMAASGGMEIETVINSITVNHCDKAQAGALAVVPAVGGADTSGGGSAVLAAPAAGGDELTQRIQKDLVALGYEPGNTDGEMSTDTTVAIAKYQAEHEMPVSGEVSPVLAGIMSAEVDKKKAAGGVVATGPAARDPAELQAAQQACLQEKMAAAQAASKKKRGFGRLLSAVTRTASHTGNYDVARTAGDVYNANATAQDLSAAAKDLGLTEDEVAECQNPG